MYCLSSVHLRIHFMVTNVVEKCVTLFDKDVYLKNLDGSQQMYNVFDLFLTRNHSMKSLCVNFLSLCT